MGVEYVKASDNDESTVNKVVVEKINFKIPEEGEKISRLLEIAKEKNVDYQPSEESIMAYNMWIERKGFKPISMEEANLAVPVYNPGGSNNGGPGMPPGGGNVTTVII